MVVERDDEVPGQRSTTLGPDSPGLTGDTYDDGDVSSDGHGPTYPVAERVGPTVGSTYKKIRELTYLKRVKPGPTGVEIGPKPRPMCSPLLNTLMGF